VWVPVKRAFVVALAALLGCNSILGIDAAHLEQSEGGAGAGGGSCSIKSTDPCNSCIAQNCCAQFDACIADTTCKEGLIKYAFCLGNNFTSDAGATCDEDFLSSAGLLSANLAQCTFMDHCTAACKDQTFGDLCFTYCNCMADVCPDHPFDAGTCEQVCDKFDPTNLVCRPYHCNLAQQNRTDPAKRLLHCGHASGNPPCH
jgi:hypothetical protein